MVLVCRNPLEVVGWTFLNFFFLISKKNKNNKFRKVQPTDVGDGTRIKLWEDVQCRDCSLNEAFPKLYSISRTREVFVSEVMRFSNGRLHWDIRFRRPPQDWESKSFNLF